MQDETQGNELGLIKSQADAESSLRQKIFGAVVPWLSAEEPVEIRMLGYWALISFFVLSIYITLVILHVIIEFEGLSGSLIFILFFIIVIVILTGIPVIFFASLFYMSSAGFAYKHRSNRRSSRDPRDNHSQLPVG